MSLLGPNGHAIVMIFRYQTLIVANGVACVGQVENQVDVVIIGAGVAGLTAARELESRGISYVVLEAQDHIGGRCVTRMTKHGTRYNPGAHWLHGGERNAMAGVIRDWSLGFVNDPADKIYSYVNDEPYDEVLRDDIRVDEENAVRTDRLNYKTVNAVLPRSRKRELYSDYARRSSSGLSKASHTSAREIFNAPYNEGGWILTDGMEKIPEMLARDIPDKRILLSTPIRLVENFHDHVKVHTKDGDLWTAKHVICTPSIGALGNIRFHPSFKTMFGRQTKHLVMGNLCKLVLEVSSKFSSTRPNLHNACMDFFNEQSIANPQPSQIFLFSGGMPLITAFFTEEALDADPKMLKKIVLAKTDLLPDLAGIHRFIVGEPIKTDWDKNQFFAGAYSSCGVGGRRINPPTFQRISLAGEAFDAEAPGHVTGAWRSGKAAAKKVIRKLEGKAESLIERIGDNYESKSR
jgi:monoamine oxidase